MAKKTTTDSKTLELIREVKRKKDEIRSAEKKPNWVTHRNFSYTEDSSKVIPLHIEANVRNLVCIAAFLRDKEKSFKEAAVEIGADGVSFTWQNFTVDQWVSDIKLRVNKLNIASKREKLEALEARLNSIISPELRAEMELEVIAAALQ